MYRIDPKVRRPYWCPRRSLGPPLQHYERIDRVPCSLDPHRLFALRFALGELEPTSSSCNRESPRSSHVPAQGNEGRQSKTQSK